MVLTYGPDERWRNAFASIEEAHSLWVKVRELLLPSLGPGHRPFAFWQFETKVPRPSYDREASFLYEANMLGEAEQRALEAYWREEFDRSCGRQCDERDAHHKWADIPQSLIETWHTEAKRQCIRDVMRWQNEAEEAEKEARPVSSSPFLR
jgi:hypothetical protein